MILPRSRWQKNKGVNALNLTVVRQRRAARCPSSAELNGLIGCIDPGMLLQVALHQVYRGSDQAPPRNGGFVADWNLQPRWTWV